MHCNNHTTLNQIGFIWFVLRIFTWLHPPEIHPRCRWSSRCIHQLCSWYDPTLGCIQPGSLASNDQWSIWLCPSETGWQQLQTRSSPQLCKDMKYTWSPKTGSWRVTGKQKGTLHIRSEEKDPKWGEKIVTHVDQRQNKRLWLWKNTPDLLQSVWRGSWLLPAAGRIWCPLWAGTWWTHRYRRNPVWKGCVSG